MKLLFKEQETAFVYHRCYHAAQAKWAQKMDGLINSLSRRKLICLLLLFTLFTTGYFIYNIYTAFTKSTTLAIQNTATIKIINSKN